jgi:hypothetical protein
MKVGIPGINAYEFADGLSCEGGNWMRWRWVSLVDSKAQFRWISGP